MISQAYIALIGGATRQAVNQSGNARKWLDCRVRRELTSGMGGDKGCGRLRFRRDRKSLDLREFFRGVVKRLKTLQPYVPGVGQRPKRDNVDLAAFLGVRYRKADSAAVIISRYLTKMRKACLQALWGKSGMRWYKVQQALDAWVPRWPNRKPGIPEDHPFRRYLATSEQLREYHRGRREWERKQEEYENSCCYDY